MAQYIVVAGGHCIDGKVYNVGDIINTDKDLIASLGSSRVQRVMDVSIPVAVEAAPAVSETGSKSGGKK